MKTNDLIVRPLLGIDERIPAPPGTAALVDNFRVDWQTGGWSNRLGYEKLFTGTTTFSPFVGLGRIDSVFMWAERSSALRWLLLESGGVLFLVNYWRGSLMPLQSDRRRFALNEASSSYVPTPQGVLIANGERVKRFNGWPVDLSVSTVPSNLLPRVLVNHGYELYPPSPDPYDVQAGNDDWTTALASGHSTATLANSNQDRGLGVGLYNSGGGTPTATYRWRISFVDQTGSESAVSPPSTATSWTPTQDNGKVVPVEIPVGPVGTIARRLYRTAYNDETYRLAAQIPNNVERLYYDSVPDSQLGGAAPLTLTPMPAPQARYAAQAAECVFIDGGPANPQALYWSQPGTPAQYDLSDYAYLGGPGGDITGLAGYYNALIVFRERQVDVLTGTYPNFRVAPLLTDAGGSAPHSAQPVPGFGLVFLADDGVYSLTGGLEGGAVAQAKRLSDPIQGWIRRINRACVQSSQAVVCRTWREYQLWVPVDGASGPSVGLIFHYDSGQWSVRSGWPVSCVTSTPEGEVIFGHIVGASGSNDLESGLFVMSEARQMGYEKPGEEFIPADPPTSVYLSRLEAAGDPGDKKHPRYVTLHTMNTGSFETPLTFEADRGAVTNTTAALTTQSPDRALQPTYTSGIDGEQAVWGTSTWQLPLPTDPRYSGVLDGSSYVQFRLSTTNDILLTGYTLGIVTSATRVIEGRGTVTRRSM